MLVSGFCCSSSPSSLFSLASPLRMVSDTSTFDESDKVASANEVNATFVHSVVGSVGIGLALS